MIDKILNTKNRISYHILFWLGYILFYTVFWGSYEGNYWDQFLQLLFLLPWKIIPTYITLYYLMPKYLYLKKMGAYIVLSVILAISMALIDRYMTWSYLYPWFYADEVDHWDHSVWYFPKILNSLIRVYTPVFVAMAIKLQRFYYQKDQINKALEKEKIETELKFLKAQIHPHFLFNTLNSIYSLSLKKSTKTPDSVLGLSKFLDYMLYECNDKFITVEREWEQLMNLVELEKLRYGDKLTISTKLKDDNQESLIPPLLLLPFVENAFKHGADNLISDSWINIDLRLKDQQLLFMVENSKAPVQTNEVLDSDKNIGLKNVRRRLELFFPDKHELKILEEPDSFLVKLEIDLSGIST
ncbi:sensor histidine kinase [Flagellimonas sp.]|uniref:sensor histidine kinase n=1 Tax=Flagellimonas sp. TaxID=2058762 RepID=UPI003B58D0A8